MLTPPKKRPGAIPTLEGWSYKGKIIARRKISQSDIDEYMGKSPAAAPIIEADPVVEEAAPTAEPLIEADPESDDLSSMTKAELIEWGAEIGIELDSTMTKAEMLSELEG